MADLEGKTPGNGDIGEFAYLDAKNDQLNAYESYMLNTYGNEQRKINRDVDLIFNTEDYPDELYAEVMDQYVSYH
jgi:sulfatase modifying factor 1